MLTKIAYRTLGMAKRWPINFHLLYHKKKHKEEKPVTVGKSIPPFVGESQNKERVQKERAQNERAHKERRKSTTCLYTT